MMFAERIRAHYQRRKSDKWADIMTDDDVLIIELYADYERRNDNN